MTNNKKRVYELSLQELFPKTLTDTSCTYIDGGREVGVATEMCAEYLESAIDSIVVLDDSKIIYEKIQHLSFSIKLR